MHSAGHKSGRASGARSIRTPRNHFKKGATVDNWGRGWVEVLENQRKELRQLYKEAIELDRRAIARETAALIEESRALGVRLIRT